MNTDPYRKHLQLCQKLGIRYLPSEPIPPTVSPVQPTSQKQAMESPSFKSEILAPVDYSKLKVTWNPNQTEIGKKLLEFYGQICECQKCSLGASRKNFVFGSGNPQTEIMFVGEAPGEEEDSQGLPFVGRAGQLLTKIIESVGLWKRNEVFICNILKCRPPFNRQPQPSEVEACFPYIHHQIQLIQPKMIVALGLTAAVALLKTKSTLGKLRNQWHDYAGIPLRVTYHPAALLRVDAYKKEVWDDMKIIRDKFMTMTNKK